MAEHKMTEEEFAKRVEASVATVGRFRRAGLIDYHQYGRRVYYLEEDVESWHRTMKHQAWASKSRDYRKAS